MQLVGGKAGLDAIDFVHGLGGGKAVVLHHELVGDGHDLPEHIGRLVGQANVVAVALRHLLHAISALKQWQREADLGLHAHLLHELATGEQVEQLVGAPELHIGLDDHGVVGLHDRVEELVQADGLARRVAVVEVVAL